MTRYIKAVSTLGTLATVIALGACATSSSLHPAPATAGVTTAPIGLATQWAGTISPLMASGIMGTSAAVSGPLKTSVTASIHGVVPGESHPWHVHVGQCGDNGKIVGDPKSYPLLTASADSAAATSATVLAELLPGTRYYVNIHKSASEMGVIVACGALSPSST